MSVLWIDVEGFEAEILRGAGSYPDRYCRAMCVEATPELLDREGLDCIDPVGSRHFGRVATLE